MGQHKDEVERRFKHYPPTTDDQVQRHERWRDKVKALAHEAHFEIPAGRELAVVLTKLEEAMMWGNAGIARNHPSQKPDTDGSA